MTTETQPKVNPRRLKTHRPTKRLTHPSMVTKNWGLLESRQTYLQFLMLQDFLAQFFLELGANPPFLT